MEWASVTFPDIAIVRSLEDASKLAGSVMTIAGAVLSILMSIDSLLCLSPVYKEVNAV